MRILQCRECTALEKIVTELICLPIVLLFFGLSFGMVWLLERL
jgi:hypothetical protein